MRETELYAPVKGFLEAQGYEVKGEVGACDVVGVRGADDPVVVELKTGFSLSLVHQGVARQSITDDVYLAVPRGTGKRFLKALKENITLCRRLGLGLITVRMRDGLVEPHLDPAPYRPRLSKHKRGMLLREFARRVGDPNAGGATRIGLVTAYRQDALLCAGHLSAEGPSKGAHVAAATGVARATQIMAADHYGWFERVSLGVYALTPKGQEGLTTYAGRGAQAPLSSEDLTT
jgi:hypothetical protein